MYDCFSVYHSHSRVKSVASSIVHAAMLSPVESCAERPISESHCLRVVAEPPLPSQSIGIHMSIDAIKPLWVVGAAAHLALMSRDM